MAFDCWVRWDPIWPTWTHESGDVWQDWIRLCGKCRYEPEHYCRVKADGKTWNGYY